MKAKELPPVEVLREHFTYNPETGELRWKVKGKKRRLHTEAGSCNSNDYRRLYVCGDFFQAHRICWALYYGEDPAPNIIDHKNGVRNDNRISNLRIATESENNINRPLQRNSTTGYRGVAYHKQSRKWQAYINIEGKRHFLGLYISIEGAIAARLNYERENNIFVRG